MPTLEEALHHTAKRLSQVGIDTAALDASLLLERATGKSRLEFILDAEDELDADAAEYLEELVQKRLEREPIAYILGEKEFWGLPFKVRPGVLIPRPDSETLIATILTFLPDKNLEMKIADIGVGSGCLLLTLLHEYPKAVGYGLDISPTALSVAADNAQALGVADRVTLSKGDGAAGLKEEVSIFISNPPYISSTEIEELDKDVKDYEPMQALHGGEDGLDMYRSLIPQAYDKLHSGGLLVFEIGHTQKQSVTALLKEEQWQDVACYQDLAERDRIIVAVRR